MVTYPKGWSKSDYDKLTPGQKTSVAAYYGDGSTTSYPTDEGRKGGRKGGRKVKPAPGSTEWNEAKAAEAAPPEVESFTVKEAGGMERTYFGRQAQKMAASTGGKRMVAEGNARAMTTADIERLKTMSPQDRANDPSLTGMLDEVTRMRITNPEIFEDTGTPMTEEEWAFARGETEAEGMEGGTLQEQLRAQGEGETGINNFIATKVNPFLSRIVELMVGKGNITMGEEGELDVSAEGWRKYITRGIAVGSAYIAVSSIFASIAGKATITTATQIGSKAPIFATKTIAGKAISPEVLKLFSAQAVKGIGAKSLAKLVGTGIAVSGLATWATWAAVDNALAVASISANQLEDDVQFTGLNPSTALYELQKIQTRVRPALTYVNIVGRINPARIVTGKTFIIAANEAWANLKRVENKLIGMGA